MLPPPGAPVPAFASRRRPERGFILITVLAIVVLLVATVVAFLLRAASERVSSSGYSASVSARQLGDTAVNLVQGQIQLATTQGIDVAWASQPGMIRAFDQSGNLLQAYKLYSTAAMVAATPGVSAGKSDDAPPADWAASPALWTDLNAPVQTSSGAEVYPILDPGATAAGYAVASAPGATATQPVPMAVRWLYVLQDGTIAAPTGSGKAATVAEETASNKIVGRIAFWTDDETCKVNINTAGAGTFWDVPRAYSVLPNPVNGVKTSGVPAPGSATQEQAFGYYQPTQQEFQRYPGHPAMTDLRAVFPALTPDQIYAMTPRLLPGGSAQGTVQVASKTALSAAFPGFPKANRLYASLDELLFKPDRTPNPALTEAQLEQAKFFLTAHSRAPETNLFNLPRIACWPIDSDLAANPLSPYTTAFDRLIAFCASTGTGNAAPYYFQRHSSQSATADAGIARNRLLYAYLQYLTGLSSPGFPNGTFAAKYGADRDQILTEIFDYIRCVNLYDTSLDPGAATPTHAFTAASPGHATPAVMPNGTMGFGRSVTVSKLALGFICNADGQYGSPAAPLFGSPAAPILPTSANVTHEPEHTYRMSNCPVAVQVDQGGPTKAAYRENHAFAAADSSGAGNPLGPTEKYIQAILVPEFFSAACGYIGIVPNFKITVSGLSSLSVTTADGQKNLFPNDSESVTYATNGPYSANWFGTSGANSYGGSTSWRFFAVSTKPTTAVPVRYVRVGPNPPRNQMIAEPGIAAGIDDPYNLIGSPIRIADAGSMDFSGGALTVVISDPSGAAVQTLKISFPQAKGAQAFPVPKLAVFGGTGTVSGGSGITATLPEAWWSFNKSGVFADGTPANPVPAGGGGRFNFINQDPGTQGMPGAASNKPFGGAFFLADYDVVRTLVVPHGDYRLVAANPNVAAGVFQPHRYYYTTAQTFASNLTNPSITTKDPGYDTGGKYIGTFTYPSGHTPDIDATQADANTPYGTGDYDDPLPDYLPGPYINKPNEGATLIPTSKFGSIPYYNSVIQTTSNSTGVDQQNDQGSFFSPNRMMPSPVMFGSLPTGVKAGQPWQTLLFRPFTAADSKVPTHIGAQTPADHLLLDLFWMPVVEPYAISDRFSTAGKINMNYQIVPFTYITRSTGMRALLWSEMATAMPNTQISSYKDVVNGSATAFRLAIDPAQTLSQFDSRFAGGDIFRSASEICTEEIVPTGQTAAGMAAFWAKNLLTGDNVRERIYASLYPRLTTKSNTFTVHFQAQSLKKALGSAAGAWTEGRDLVTGEYRGSTTLERFVDANNASIPDYGSDPTQAGDPSKGTLDKYYRWRVVANRQFAP